MVETEDTFVEGDIVIDEPPEGFYSPIVDTSSKRELRRHQEFLWVSRVVPYEISPVLGR